jgi:two-component system response regulator
MLRALKKNNLMNEIVVARDGVQALDYLFGEGAHAGRSRGKCPRWLFLI